MPVLSDRLIRARWIFVDMGFFRGWVGEKGVSGCLKGLMALVERLDVLLAARSCACELFLRQNFANALHFVFAQYFSLKTADIAVKLAYIAYVLGHGG